MKMMQVVDMLVEKVSDRAVELSECDKAYQTLIKKCQELTEALEAEYVAYANLERPYLKLVDDFCVYEEQLKDADKEIARLKSELAKLKAKGKKK